MPVRRKFGESVVVVVMNSKRTPEVDQAWNEGFSRNLASLLYTRFRVLDTQNNAGWKRCEQPP